MKAGISMFQYKAGDRVRLVSTTALYTTAKPGDTGTVARAGKYKLAVRFDDGPTLDILHGMDEVEPADPPSTVPDSTQA